MSQPSSKLTQSLKYVFGVLLTLGTCISLLGVHLMNVENYSPGPRMRAMMQLTLLAWVACSSFIALKTLREVQMNAAKRQRSLIRHLAVEIYKAIKAIVSFPFFVLGTFFRKPKCKGFDLYSPGALKTSLRTKEQFQERFPRISAEEIEEWLQEFSAIVREMGEFSSQVCLSKDIDEALAMKAAELRERHPFLDRYNARSMKNQMGFDAMM